MKVLIFILFLFIGTELLAQVDNYTGAYETHSLAADGSFELKRSITLNADGTFVFHNYRRVEIGIPPETNIWGKGKWTSVKNQIRFSAAEELDIDEKYSLNFGETKARYKSKSPRDISKKVVKTSLIFYDSNISWVKGMELFKTDD